MRDGFHETAFKEYLADQSPNPRIHSNVFSTLLLMKSEFPHSRQNAIITA